jgi:hypothetical protein
MYLLSGRSQVLSVLLPLAMILVVALAAPAGTTATQPSNLALHKPATASSSENDEHNPIQANDGDAATVWRADDEPADGAEWWQVDLEKPAGLTGCQIVWPFEGKSYQCKVEGSADGKTWVLLSDQTKNTAKSRVQDLKFDHPGQVRYVRVTITGFEPGSWASLSEVKVFGTR